jgi:2-polyprenyl-6-methoxyphenol hydroxylase-like FAD-dependent oxidoreductase
MHARRFESYEEDSQGVTVHFQGGRPGPVRAKVLVGADGYFSAVRQQCLGDGPPDFGVRCSKLPCMHALLVHPPEHMLPEWRN